MKQFSNERNPRKKKKRFSERSAFTISSVEKKKTVCPPSREVLLREKKIRKDKKEGKEVSQ